MAKRLVSASKLTAIGDAIRAKAGSSNLMTLDEMAVSIGGLGGIEVIDIGTSDIILGYYIDEACTQEVTISYLIENLVTNPSPVTLFRSRLDIVSWSSGTDEQINMMLTAADQGFVDLSDCWSIGDKRDVRVNAVSSTGISDAITPHTNKLVIMHDGSAKTLTTPTAGGKTSPNFIVGFESCLCNAQMRASGYNNSYTNAYVDGKAINTYLESSLLNAIESTINFKQFKETVGAGGTVTDSTSTQIYDTRISLPALYEVRGIVDGNFKNEGVLWDFYNTAANRQKLDYSGASSSAWWTRSPAINSANNFVLISTSGTNSWYGATARRGISPYLCI